MYTVHINETFNTESSFLLHAVKNGVILLLCYLLPLIRVTFSHLPHMWFPATDNILSTMCQSRLCSFSAEILSNFTKRLTQSLHENWEPVNIEICTRTFLQ